MAVRTMGGERNDIVLPLATGGAKACLHRKFRAMTATRKIVSNASD